MKIQCRLDYLKHLNILIRESKTLPNIYSDHCAVTLTISVDETSPPRGLGFWKFNNSVLSDTKYVEMLSFQIPNFAEKHQDVDDKGLYWEMIKMEIRALTINHSKQRARETHNEEKI